MKVLFLDIDGVLNSQKVFENWTSDSTRTVICPVMVERINRVIAATDCRIVISSSWRFMWEMGELMDILGLHGLWASFIIDQTPRLDRRDEEILAWLKEHPEVSKFAVVDDDGFDLTNLTDNLVQTEWEHGIQDDHVDRLIHLLSHSS